MVKTTRVSSFTKSIKVVQHKLNSSTNKQSEKKLSAKDLSAFCLQVSFMLQAGISIHEGIGILLEDCQDNAEKALFKGLYDQLEFGEPFFKALKDSGHFPKYMVDMIQVGEMAGQLDKVMHSLYTYYQREQNLKETIKGAITYPAIMMGMMTIVIILLVVKVMPIFQQVFFQLGSDLSPLARNIMNIGQSISQYAIIILVISLVAVIALVFFSRSIKGKAFFKKFSYHCIGIKRIALDMAVGRFVSSMSLTLSSGLDIDDSLKMVIQLVDHPIVAKKVEQCQIMVSEGHSFTEAVNTSGILSKMNARMLSVGFHSGKVDTVMAEIATRCEDDTTDKINSLVGMIEPTLVAVLSLIVGGILLSVMLPLMGIMSSIS